MCILIPCADRFARMFNCPDVQHCSCLFSSSNSKTFESQTKRQRSGELWRTRLGSGHLVFSTQKHHVLHTHISQNHVLASPIYNGTPILTAATLHCMHLHFISPMSCLCFKGLRNPTSSGRGGRRNTPTAVK